jgi:hypothetical protein
MEKPASTWSFDQGTLTVHHLGKTVSLGGYATRKFAAKAAAVYFAKHGGYCCLPPQSRRAAAKARQSGRRSLREPSNAEISERANGELLERADTAAIEAASINRRMYEPSYGQMDRMYPPELLRVEAAECRRGAIGMSPRVERTLLALAERLESQATILEARESADRRQEIVRDLPKSEPDRVSEDNEFPPSPQRRIEGIPTERPLRAAGAGIIDFSTLTAISRPPDSVLARAGSPAKSREGETRWTGF